MYPLLITEGGSVCDFFQGVRKSGVVFRFLPKGHRLFYEKTLFGENGIFLVYDLTGIEKM